MGEKDKTIAKSSKRALLKLKKKLKERDSLNRSTEVCRTSEMKDHSKIVKAGRIAGNDNAKKSSQSKLFDISVSAESAEANIGRKTKKTKSKNDGKRKRKDLHAAKERKIEESQKERVAARVYQIPSVDEDCSSGMKKNCKKDGLRKRKGLYTAKERKMMESQSEVDAEKVDQISSVDEDCSRGMKKWLIQYKESRPGLKILQQRIDEFITAYEAQQEQERNEREARAAEGGWTVVVHHKGRKKTTDSESGIAVGSVAQAAVMDKMEKKKNKEVALDFYRFQKREAQRNEVMMLQSKFEQDKKRIQQLRAARKFRPY